MKLYRQNISTKTPYIAMNLSFVKTAKNPILKPQKVVETIAEIASILCMLMKTFQEIA